MGSDIKRKVIRAWSLAAISALAMILVAAGVDLDQNWVRLRRLPREQRLKLIENLRRFDLVLKTEQQQALRDLDRRIAELARRATSSVPRRITPLQQLAQSLA